MKIGILTDIHNNAVALEAVLGELERAGCERFICAGDIIGIGPYPEQTVRRMREMEGLIAVKGNHERYLTEGMPLTCPNEERMEYEEMAHHRWEHAQLSKASVDFLRALPLRATLSVHGRHIAVIHYPMDERQKYAGVRREAGQEAFWDAFAGETEDIVVYGHDHARCIATKAGQLFVNSGSLGCPGAEKDLARAAVLEVTPDGRAHAQALDVRYDVCEVVAQIDRLGYPDAHNIKRFFFGVYPA